MSARVTFDMELERLNHDLIHMGGMVEEAIDCSIRALFNRDENLARQVAEGDKVIDDMEKTVESQCMRLLLRQQPVARDLRAISTALKMITDLERIGDQAQDIAVLSLSISGSNEGCAMAKHIPVMGNLAIDMVRGSIDSVVKSDVQKAKEILNRDDEMDDLFTVVKQELIKVLTERPAVADRAIDLMMVAKYLERIADHAVNICEWVIFYSTGVHKETKIL